MKKLMIAAAIAMVAIVSQAATVTWSMTNVSKDGAALDNGYAYVFSTVAGTYKSVAALQAALEACTSVADVNGILATSLGDLNSAVNGGAASVSGVDLETAGIPEKTANTKLFAVVFDSDTVTEDSKYYITTTSAGVKTPAYSTTNKATYTLGSQSASAAEGAWQNAVATPEPTSGLLLLLGVAGLALRRRRA